MVPKGWRFCKLADISRVTSGGTPNRAISEYWQNGTIPWIRTTEVQNCILQPEDAKEYISELGLRKSSAGNDSNLLIVFYVQIMPDDFVMQLHRF
ncbi:restriction endonuclease subunit S [Escherichia coli]|uniref:restriction endonuclease subunit S n=1 Tax=Escherichia coli TaxID=562 RepID=UPI001CBD1560|nr:restriction endonuclease subunit S [Escherichia coli]MBZ2285112.1 restriction endonuclease subunit S [Escherichia coli]